MVKYMLGCNKQGQLGLNSEDDYKTKPELVSDLSNVKIIQIAAGAKCSFALTDDNKVYS